MTLSRYHDIGSARSRAVVLPLRGGKRSPGVAWVADPGCAGGSCDEAGPASRLRRTTHATSSSVSSRQVTHLATQPLLSQDASQDGS